MKTKVVLVSLTALLLSACNLPTGDKIDERALNSAVAQTLEAAGDSTGQVLATAEVIESAEATPDPTVAPPQTLGTQVPSEDPGVLGSETLKIAYINGGDVWYLEESGAPRQLTTGGMIVEVVISSDGRWVTYEWQDPARALSELRAVSTDTGEERVLLSQSDLDSLYPLEDALHIAPSKFEFLPGSHTLLLNTHQIFEGPGLVKNDDLWTIEVESGIHTQMLEPGQGGDFVVSPDGESLALVKPTSIGFVRTDGTGLIPNRLTFPFVITYSEYAYYPIPVWSGESDEVAILIPAEDPFVEDSARVWLVPTSAEPASPLLDLSDFSYFRNSGSPPLISPDLSMVGWLYDSGGSSTDLRLAAIDGSMNITYESGSLSWLGWNPNSQDFVYGSVPKNLFLGQVGAPTQGIGFGGQLRWVDQDRYFYLDELTTTHRFVLADLRGGSAVLDEIAGDTFDYDFAR